MEPKDGSGSEEESVRVAKDGRWMRGRVHRGPRPCLVSNHVGVPGDVRNDKRANKPMSSMTGITAIDEASIRHALAHRSERANGVLFS